MKVSEKIEALKLRRKGYSINEIAEKIGVSKASISTWVRDIQLTPNQRAKINERGYSIEAIEKRRKSRIENTLTRHKAIIDSATNELENYSDKALFYLGLGIYWGEGGKVKRGQVKLANTDPDLIKTMMRFFREIMKVPEEKFRGHVHAFEHVNPQEAERYWSGISGIPTTQFYKTYTKQSSASQNKRERLPYGTFEISVPSTELFLKLMGYLEKFRQQV